MRATKEINNEKTAKIGLNPTSHFTQLTSNKGITLIALIITIIVMLILVAVTISMAINGGLFAKAGEAVRDTQEAINKEQQLADGRIKIGDKWYASIDDYLIGKEIDFGLIVEPIEIALVKNETDEMEDEETLTGELEATLLGMQPEPEVSWEVIPADQTAISLSATKGKTITVTAIGTENAEVKIKAKCTYEEKEYDWDITVTLTITPAPQEGTLPTYANANKDATSGILKENATYTSGEYTAVVPKGFKIVEGINGTTTIADGLVIQDADENEFVWIPVTFAVAEESLVDSNGLYPEFLEVFYRSNWSNNARGTKKYTSTSSYKEPYASGYTTPTTESADYYEMMRSVQENKGFYIGRYEAGSVDTDGKPVARTDTANGTSKVVVKQDQYPYTYVGWGLTMSDYTSDVTFEDYNQGKGALYLSKHMYDGKDIGATSTLCYGIQWDAMLDFIKDSTHDVTKSTKWGNHADSQYNITRTSARYATFNKSTWLLEDWAALRTAGISKTSSESMLLTTGADKRFAAKNIYDVAGNVYEWTNEATPSGRMFRGGYYYNFGSNYPASDRNLYKPDTCENGIGFRPGLYIK